MRRFLTKWTAEYETENLSIFPWRLKSLQKAFFSYLFAKVSQRRFVVDAKLIPLAAFAAKFHH